MKIRTFLIKFTAEIRQSEIPLFRGAINAILEENHSILFHNHTDDGLRYSYPLIQYKRIGDKAAIVCVGEGTDAIGEFFNKQEFSLQIGKRNVNCEVDEIITKHHEIAITKELMPYRIRKWLPFNSENYENYMKSNGIVEKYQMLEKIMTGNILSMAKGLKITIETPLCVKLEEIIDSDNVTFKGIKMMCFDFDFMANITIPDFIGVGKGVSHGFGNITSRK
ncbi:MAG: hypothetical protein E7077_01310 [Bacteroidales bacterium]|jgi:hypothetical protein|nr:hypothetical protein [Bacteroidales bacterium]